MKKLCWKIIAVLLVFATLMTSLPLSAFAEEKQGGTEMVDDLYIKEIKLAQAKTKDEARDILEADGFILLEENLNAGTNEDGIWLGYKTTTDPLEAVYDIKLMNMKGGFNITSMKEALEAQEAIFAEMANDLNYLIDEFIEAYDEGSVPAQKAYKALNFFRMVEGETILSEENGLGYQIVHGNLSHSILTEIIMLCDSVIVDSVIKILTMGIQVRNDNWMEELSELGPYDEDVEYMEDKDELKRRAEQLLAVISLYAESYNAMYKSGLIPEKFDENFEPDYGNNQQVQVLTAQEADAKKRDENRYKFYKIVFDELESYKYGDSGETLKDFICSLAEGGSTKQLYPLASVLSDGEFAALSYGCFLEVASGASATASDFDDYDEVYANITKDVKSVYLYSGVDEALLKEDSVIAFTEEATRHMASTGDLEFYEKESTAEDIWETGKYAAMALGAAGMAVMGIAKLTVGTIMLVSYFSSASLTTGILAGVVKVCTLVGSLTTFGIALAVVAAVVLVFFLISIIVEEIQSNINWDKNPIPMYIYDVKEVTIRQNSDGGISTEHIKRPVFKLYEAVTDINGQLIDLNAYSSEALQWITMYVSYDRQGSEAKPIKASDIIVKYGNGETPEGYAPLARFGEVIAYDMNQWDEDDDVNGVYMFYNQDQEVAVDDGKTYYISEVYLQSGKSDSHCIELLKSSNYIPINVNLSPNLSDGDIVFRDYTYTYLGYKLTTNEENAIRDLRIEYGNCPAEVKYGAATYAECGTNGMVTLYATKYKTAGTPILAAGLKCVTNRDDIGEGWEPVNLFSGGPAVSVNAVSYGDLRDSTSQYIYFLPQTTFTSGEVYLGGIAYFASESLRSVYNADQRAEKCEEAFANSGYHYSVVDGDVSDTILYYQTYNPYRAIYKMKATELQQCPDTFFFESVGYVKAARISWNFVELLKEGVSYYYDGFTDGKSHYPILGAFYLAGNPSSNNIYKEWREEIEDETDSETEGKGENETQYELKKGMSVVEPIKLSSILIWNTDENLPANIKASDSSFKGLADVFSDSKDVVEIKIPVTAGRVYNSYSIYISDAADEKPYVSGFTAADKLTLYRAYGGYDAGLTRNAITDSMLTAQLANQGATNFLAHEVKMIKELDAYEGTIFNRMKFGYMRTADEELALRDIFFYFSGFSTDAAPQTMYRGDVEYTLICSLPYNLTGYNGAPGLGIHLYGTTDSRVGSRIIDIEVSDSPYMNGYETIRTINGRSIWSEVKDYAKALSEDHIMGWARDMYEDIGTFFDLSDSNMRHRHYYIHIKREVYVPDVEPLYIEKLYLGNNGAPIRVETDVLNQLFDMGADGYVNVNLNEGAGGHLIYLGYSYTNDPTKAIKEIRAYHQSSHPQTLRDDYGRLFTLVSDLDVNKGAGAFSDYIYLYTTTESANADPIVDLSVDFDAQNRLNATKIDGQWQTFVTRSTKMWDSDSYSDLNDGGGGEYIYLSYTTVNYRTVGATNEIDYGEDETYSRDGYKNQSADGKYVGGIYVMDKNTIRQEKIARGVNPADCTCDKITDQDVFDRLKSMGATTIIKTPILVTGEGYFDGNQNKVFIGYSRTNKSRDAIKSIAIKSEVLNLDEPKTKIEVDKKTHYLVAEAAENVKELPRAINLIGIQDSQDLLIPRMYLYYSTSGSDPIYDIVIDDSPLKTGWLTAVSGNCKDPFVDIYEMANQQYVLANKDDKDSYDWEILYTDPLFEWMSDVAELFAPEDAEAVPFYIHYKNYSEETLEEIKPYIGEIFVEEGNSRHEALSKLLAHQPDGFIDCDLNKEAGGTWIYMAYKRVEKAKDAITDLAIFEGKDPEPSRRIYINETNVKYSLLVNIDLNHSAGGKYIYLYHTDSDETGNPITQLNISEGIVNSVKCGVEQATVRRADGKAFTDEYININKEAGGITIYLIMNRETTEGHRKSEVLDVILKEATCGKDGSETKVMKCLDCDIRIEEVTTLEATGNHVDKDGDEDHKCDVCKKRNVTEHLVGKGKVTEVVNPEDDQDGYQITEYYCGECLEYMSEEKKVIPAGSIFLGEKGVFFNASLLGQGSIISICSLACIAIFAAVFIYMQKNKTKKSNGDTDHEKDN